MYALSYPYRENPMPEGRHSEAYRRLRRALSSNHEPSFDALHCDPQSCFLNIVRRAADLITEWYTPYLTREIRQASHYEEAWPAASLLAFSGKMYCINALGNLMVGNRPLEVLVSIDALADVVALSPTSDTRDQAYRLLRGSRLEIAQRELDIAMSFSNYPSPRAETILVMSQSSPYYPFSSVVLIPKPENE